MNIPKLIIASDGKKSAVLLNGVMFGKGVSSFSLTHDNSTPILNIEGINVEQFEAGTKEDFLSFCECISRNELRSKG